MAIRWWLLGASCILLMAGCSSTPPGKDGRTPQTEDMSGDQMVQTDFNRTVTIAMRDNLNGLYVLLDKLYRRNPREWRKNKDVLDEPAAVQRVKSLVEKRQPPTGLAGLHDIQILAVSLNPGYVDDRVAAFIYGLADTIITAHGDRVRFHAFDALDGQRVYNAARNVEAAAWLLATRKTVNGPLLLSNEIGDGKVNLSFEREFGAIIGRLDLVSNLLGENVRRVGINYVQSLMLFNFLPVR